MSLEWLNRLSDRAILLVLLIIGVATSGASFVFNVTNEGIRGEWLEGWFQNFSTEMFGAFLAFWLLGMIVERRRQWEHLTREMGSRDNATALNALTELHANGWVTDGSLQRAYLSGANLHGAFLAEAKLQDAFLSRANLQEAVLQDANLRGTRLEEANLQGVNLKNANLSMAELANANLTAANLENADLYGARMRGALLHGANLKNANLLTAELDYAAFDEKTMLPDDNPRGKRSLWTPDTDMARFTAPWHPDFWRSNYPKSPAYRGREGTDET